MQYIKKIVKTSLFQELSNLYFCANKLLFVGDATATG